MIRKYYIKIEVQKHKGTPSKGCLKFVVVGKSAKRYMDVNIVCKFEFLGIFSQNICTFHLALSPLSLISTAVWHWRKNIHENLKMEDRLHFSSLDLIGHDFLLAMMYSDFLCGLKNKPVHRRCSRRTFQHPPLCHRQCCTFKWDDVYSAFGCLTLVRVGSLQSICIEALSI